MTLSKKMFSEFCGLATATGLMDLNKSLIDAAARGQARAVQALLDAGADVHASHSYDRMPRDESLCRAATGDLRRLSKILLKAGADVHAAAPDRSPDFPLYLAARYGHNETVEFLLGAGADNYRGALSAAFESHNRPTIALLKKNAAMKGFTF